MSILTKEWIRQFVRDARTDGVADEVLAIDLCDSHEALRVDMMAAAGAVCVLNGDGGQAIEKKGMAAAVESAIQRYGALMLEIDRLTEIRKYALLYLQAQDADEDCDNFTDSDEQEYRARLVAVVGYVRRTE